MKVDPVHIQHRAYEDHPGKLHYSLNLAEDQGSGLTSPLRLRDCTLIRQPRKERQTAEELEFWEKYLSRKTN